MKAYFGRHTPKDGHSQADPYLVHIAWENLFTNPPPYVALDIETPSLKDRRVMGIGIATPQDDNFYFDFTDPGMPWHLFMPSATRKVWHNATFDLSLEALGKYGADKDNIEDTAIIARMLNMDVELTYAAIHTHVRTQSIRSLFAQYGVKNMTDLPWNEVALKCINDVRVTMAFYEKFKDDVNKENYEVERRITSLLLHMSHRGIKLDLNLVRAIDEEMQERVKFFEEALGFNYRSPPQTSLAMSQHGIFLPNHWDKRAQKQKWDTSANALRNANHSFADATILARQYSKLAGMLKSLRGKHRAHSHFHLDSATLRITSEDIQMHNVPVAARPSDIKPKAGPVRRVFVPDSGIWTRFDLSQIELRVLGYFCKDPNMLRALAAPIEDKEHDIHGTTNNALGLDSRLMSKNFNFGSIFGGGIGVLMQFTQIRDYNTVANYQQQYFATYPVMKQAIDRQREEGLREGYVETLHGQRLSLEIPMMQGERHAGNCAINYPIQGSAAEIFKRLLIALLDAGIPIEDFVLQVHDEELLEGRYKLPIAELEHLEPFWTPLEVSYIERWQ